MILTLTSTCTDLVLVDVAVVEHGEEGVLEGCGHGSSLTHRVEVNPAVQENLQEQPEEDVRDTDREKHGSEAETDTEGA